MNTDEALKWAYESDWGTDWGKDCKAMVQLAEEVQRLREDREWQIKQNVKMFKALEQIAQDKVGYGHMGHGQPTAIALLAQEAMVEAV